MTRRYQKSVGPSVCLSVCNANKKKPTSPLLTVEKLFAYQVKGLTIFYKKMRYFQKKIQKFYSEFSKHFVYALNALPTLPL